MVAVVAGVAPPRILSITTITMMIIMRNIRTIITTVSIAKAKLLLPVISTIIPMMLFVIRTM
jgi:hypothetical protein